MTIELDEYGFPYPRYIHDVQCALIARGIDATDPHVEEPWDLSLTVPPTGDYAGYALLLLCWRCDEELPEYGPGWYLLPHTHPDRPGDRVDQLVVPHHATPAQVAAATWSYLVEVVSQ